MANGLEIGEAYYRVTYADPELAIPSVQPLIFLGENIFDDDPEDEVIYYFQDAGEWHFYGNVLEISEKDRAKTGVISERNRGEVFDLDQVIELLQRAKNKAQREQGA